MISGIRNAPPISTSSPRDTTASPLRASADRATSRAPAALFTTMASSAPVNSTRRSRQSAWREPRVPWARSYSRFEYPVAMRAIASRAARDAMARIATGYSNLEYDLAQGTRGSRHALCRDLLVELTGAEDAIVVNNAAGALLVALSALARNGEAVVSRGELVEIGGAFRIPDIMARSGATLVEVGTTNRTHLRDYEGAVSDRTKLLLKVHRSNFQVTGFTAEVSAQEIAAVAHAHGAASLYDLGSGLLVDLSSWGLAGEPTVAEALASGVDAVVFSGDKLLGGPQAGILLGRRDAIAACRTDPLARAVRSDKFTLAALEATLALYRDPERARGEIPVLRMLTEDVAEIRRRAEALHKSVGKSARSEEHT